MTVGVPDVSNSSWQLKYKKDAKDDALERFEQGETIPNRDKPKQSKGSKKPKDESPKFNRGLPSDEANEAMWKEGKEEAKLREAEENYPPDWIHEAFTEAVKNNNILIMYSIYKNR